MYQSIPWYNWFMELATPDDSREFAPRDPTKVPGRGH